MHTASNRKEQLPRLPSRNPPQKKKQRSRGGCSNCKEKKKGCSQDRPTCDRCRERGLECVYPPLQPRRAPSSRRPTSTRRGAPAVQEVAHELEHFSFPDDSSRESSAAAMTPSLASSATRNSFDLSYFRSTLAPLLVVQGSENPLVDLVLPMANGSEVLFHAICLVSKAHQAESDDSTGDSNYLDLYQVVLGALRNSVVDGRPNHPERHLSANVLLSYFEMIRSQDSAAFEVFLRGAFPVLQFQSGTPTLTSAFMEKVLYFFDVLHSLSSQQRPFNPDPLRLALFRMPASPSLPLAIDPIFGLSAHLWPILHRLASAIHLKSQMCADLEEPPDRGRPGPDLIEMIETLETEKAEITSQLQGWVCPSLTLTTPPVNKLRAQRLVDHAEAYRTAGLLQLSVELCDMPPESPGTYTLAMSILGACRRILKEGEPILGLLWPLFIASINVTDATDIAEAQDLFSLLAQQRHTHNVLVAWKICRQVWEHRARGLRELHWHEISASLKPQMVFG